MEVMVFGDVHCNDYVFGLTADSGDTVFHFVF